MPRRNRLDKAGLIYHVFNRGFEGKKIFRKAKDFEVFIQRLGEGLERYPVEMYAYCLMPTHWHLVLRPKKDRQMGDFMRFVAATHAQRYLVTHKTEDEGKLYQSRFKSFIVQDNEYFLDVCRFVESNGLRAKKSKKAEDYKYGSLYRSVQKPKLEPQFLAPWPVKKPPRWTAKVNAKFDPDQLAELQTCVKRDRPYGDPKWRKRMANKFDLWSTINPMGRPPKSAK